MKQINTDNTIEILRNIFSIFGLPSELCSDNGAQFVNPKFKDFLERNGIRHKRTAPYHPSTNGQAERYVQTLKNKIRSLNPNKKDLPFNLVKILTQYRITPHPVTHVSPAEIVLSYPIRTKFSLLNQNSELKTSFPKFNIGDRVAARNYAGNTKWKFGNIEKPKGNLHYRVDLDDGKNWHRHSDQLREVGNDVADSDDDLGDHSDLLQTPISSKETPDPGIIPNKSDGKPIILKNVPIINEKPNNVIIQPNGKNVTIKRSSRTPKPIDRLNL